MTFRTGSRLSVGASAIHAWELTTPPTTHVVNTVFYAAVLWLLLFAAPFALRRWRGIRRGLCPKCAYDLRGSIAQVCPECGAQK